MGVNAEATGAATGAFAAMATVELRQSALASTAPETIFTIFLDTAKRPSFKMQDSPNARPGEFLPRRNPRIGFKFGSLRFD